MKHLMYSDDNDFQESTTKQFIDQRFGSKKKSKKFKINRLDLQKVLQILEREIKDDLQK